MVEEGVGRLHRLFARDWTGFYKRNALFLWRKNFLKILVEFWSICFTSIFYAYDPDEKSHLKMYFKPRTVIFHLLASYNNYFPFSPLKAHPLKLMEKKKISWGRKAISKSDCGDTGSYFLTQNYWKVLQKGLEIHNTSKLPNSPQLREMLNLNS